MNLQHANYLLNIQEKDCKGGKGTSTAPVLQGLWGCGVLGWRAGLSPARRSHWGVPAVGTTQPTLLPAQPSTFPVPAPALESAQHRRRAPCRHFRAMGALLQLRPEQLLLPLLRNGERGLTSVRKQCDLLLLKSEQYREMSILIKRQESSFLVDAESSKPVN